MSQLLRARPDQLGALQRRAERCCLAFADEPLPPGASQPTGRVGIEIEPDTGRAHLHVQQGITYDGPSDDVAAWLASGTRSFTSYRELQAWLAGPLAAAYAGQATSIHDDRATAPDDTHSAAPEPVLIDVAELEALLAEEVVGQERTIDQLAHAAALHLARHAPRRPLTALALGSTGVGKTLLAETLATAIATITDQPCDYLRLDMTEFQERHSVAKLLGAPPGYIGYGEQPRLVNTLRSGQRAVVLIDEIEKAHDDVFLAIMNLMDAGRLTPASGPPVDARHAILCFTTNLGALHVVDAFKRSPAAANDPVARDALLRDALRAHGIVPELVGRLHTLLAFDDLDAEHLDEILRRTIAREAQTFQLDITHVAPEVLASLRRQRPDTRSGVRAWEHLISVELGPTFLDACRRKPGGPLALVGSPVRLEHSEAESR